MNNIINSISTEIKRLIALYESNTYTKKDLIDLAILTKALNALNDNDN